MSPLALEVESILQKLDARTAAQLERRVREALQVPDPAEQPISAAPCQSTEEWLQRLDALRNSLITGKQGTPTEEIIDDIRAERG